MPAAEMSLLRAGGERRREKVAEVEGRRRKGRERDKAGAVEGGGDGHGAGGHFAFQLCGVTASDTRRAPPRERRGGAG